MKEDRYYEHDDDEEMEIQEIDFEDIVSEDEDDTHWENWIVEVLENGYKGKFQVLKLFLSNFSQHFSVYKQYYVKSF